MGLRVANISFSYGTTRVLSEVGFQIPTGAVWALVGRSGCGKSTLLNVVAGLYAPTIGRVVIEGRDWRAGAVRGVVFQEECLLGWLNILDNMLFPNHRSASRQATGRAQRLLAAVGLPDRYTSYPFELSVGMRRRVEVARALLADDEYFLADEPFSSVDTVTKIGLWQLWRELRATEPRTGLLCTHDPEEAARLCDAVIVLGNSRGASTLNVVAVPKTVSGLDFDDTNDDLLRLTGLIRRTLASNDEIT